MLLPACGVLVFEALPMLVAGSASFAAVSIACGIGVLELLLLLMLASLITAWFSRGTIPGELFRNAVKFLPLLAVLVGLLLFFPVNNSADGQFAGSLLGALTDSLSHADRRGLVWLVLGSLVAITGGLHWLSLPRRYHPPVRRSSAT
jgi:hypothetical protein